MKISKAELKQLIGESGACDWNCDPYKEAKNEQFKSNVLCALRDDTLDIEGYERVQWMKFDPNAIITFPREKDGNIFIVLQIYKGKIIKNVSTFDTYLWEKCNVTHWRPMPMVPNEIEPK